LRNKFPDIENRPRDLAISASKTLKNAFVMHQFRILGVKPPTLEFLVIQMYFTEGESLQDERVDICLTRRILKNFVSVRINGIPVFGSLKMVLVLHIVVR
jgi:hypothetical protein